MGFTEVLTIIFILLKVFGVISWSWWVVFLPEIIAVALYVLLVIIGVVGQNKAMKRFDRHWNDFNKHF